jgi:putative transposase
VILDIYSRYAVGWMLARVERAELSKRLITDTVAKHGVPKDQLTLHSDRGSPMIAKPVAHLLADLGVTKSHSRPHVSNDNCYSESQFRTFKYRPDFPDRFGSFEDARAHCARFFSWYNDDHRHSGIGLHTPADVHYGRAEGIRHRRGVVLLDAYAEHPERFVRKVPTAPAIPAVAWINQPEEVTDSLNQ